MDVVVDPDRALVDRAVGGDRHAFETLLRRHYDRIHRVAWRVTGSRSDAQDIAQDVCCTLVEKIGSFEGKAKFTTWLIGIVVNACRDHRRRGLSLGRMRERLAVLAGLAAPPDGRDQYRQSWLASELARLDRCCATRSCWWWARTSPTRKRRARSAWRSTVSWRMHEVRRQLNQGRRQR